MQNISFHDIIAGGVCLILIGTIAILAILQNPVPTELKDSLGFALGWLFRASISIAGNQINGKLQGNQPPPQG